LSYPPLLVSIILRYLK